MLEWEPPEDAPATARHVISLVKEHTARLRAIVSEHGWPGRSLVGEDGADAAWLLLQHVNSRVTTIRSAAGDEFCRSCVVLLRDAVVRGEAHPRHLAAIADSLRLGDDEPPEYASLPAQYELDASRRVIFRHDVDWRQSTSAGQRSGCPLWPLTWHDGEAVRRPMRSVRACGSHGRHGGRHRSEARPARYSAVTITA